MSVKRSIRVPKYVKLAEMFREQVKTGVLKPGDRLPSFVEMRQQHGIGQGTLERVHALLEEDGLITREPGRGTFIAEPALPAKTGFIGFGTFDLRDVQSFSYWTMVMSGVQHAAKAAGQQIVMLDPASPQGWDKVDGAMISVWQPELAMRWIEERVPCISVIVPVAGLSSIVADDYAGVKSATEYLIRLGHRRIACLRSTDNKLSTRRVAGYRDALVEAGIPFHPKWIRYFGQPVEYRDHMIGYARSSMREWLDDDWRDLGCTALIAHNDEVAFGAMEAMEDAGIDVPGEVSVIGFDDIDTCNYVRPRLTTVAVPLRQIGATACELLMRQINGETNKPEVTVLPTALQIRESVTPPA